MKYDTFRSEPVWNFKTDCMSCYEKNKKINLFKEVKEELLSLSKDEFNKLFESEKGEFIELLKPFLKQREEESNNS